MAARMARTVIPVGRLPVAVGPEVVEGGGGGALVGCDAGGVDAGAGGGGDWLLPVGGWSSWSMIPFLRAGKQRAVRATLRRTPSGIAPFGVKVTFGRHMQAGKL